MCLSTSSALVCCVKLFARTARRIFAALSSGSLENCPCLSNTHTGQWQRENRTRSQTRQIPVRRLLAPQQACCLHHRRVYVAASSYRPPWSALTRQFLAVLDEICEARGVRKHYSTRVHIRQDWPREGGWNRRGTQTYGISPLSSSSARLSSGCVCTESKGSTEGSRTQV